ncbi:MAG: ABC transporter substrate-binding protein, partial [Bacillota bacterium]
WNGQVVDENGNTIPYIAEIVIKIFGKNRSVANAFQSRDVDLITMDRESYRRYSGRSDITLKKYPGKKFEFIAFNLSNKILREKEVRRAIAYAVDKVKIINDIMPGEAIASDIPVIPDTWLYDTNILSYNVDREKAKKLLEDSGWKDNNGVLYKRINGVNTPLNLEMLVNDDNEVRIQAAEKVKGQLKEIGINLEIKKIKWDDEFKKIYSGKYDMVFLGCTIASIPDISFLYASSQIGTGLNIAGYRNENIDWYLYQILFESDSSRRKAYFINMKEILNQDMPYLGMYFYNDAVMYNKRIRGDLNPSVWNKYNDFIKWYIPVN